MEKENKVLGFFDDAYYINLDYRVDRKEKFEARTAELGFQAKRFSAIQIDVNDVPATLKAELDACHDKDQPHFEKYRRRKANEVSCCLSHMAIVKEAKERGLENVLIFEDDCMFLPAWKENIKQVLEEVKDKDWSIIYFGGELNNEAHSISPNLALAKGGVYCCHSYAINKKLFDPIINLDLNWCYIIDVFLINYDGNSRKYIVPKKLMTVQESNYSDLRGHNTNISAEWMISSWEKYIK